MKTVYVRKGDTFLYTCQKVMVRGGIVDKCGYCGQGNVEPKIGFKCRVCYAVVREVRKS